MSSTLVIWADSGHSLRFALRSATRTNPPFAGAAFADAAFLCSCRMVLTEKWRTSPKLPFISVDLVKNETALSLLFGQTS